MLRVMCIAVVVNSSLDNYRYLLLYEFSYESATSTTEARGVRDIVDIKKL